MYITCQQCSTIFRLDEGLLKPTGSKVRCSQCGNMFVQFPPSPVVDKPQPSNDAAVHAVSETPAEAAYDQELEGIDLDELDAIFEQGDMSTETQDTESEAPEATFEDNADVDLDDSDLDMDFELALEPEADPAGGAQADEAAVDENLDELDLDIDFEITPDEPSEDQAATESTDDEEASAEDIELDLEDLDFSLDDESAEDGAADERDDGETDLAELDAELDEDVAPGIDAAELDLEAETSAPVLEDDNELHEIGDDVAVPVEEADQAADDFELDELDSLLGGDDASGRVSTGATRDVVDEDAELELDESAPDEMTVDSEPVIESDSNAGEAEELDLSDLDAMLDEVDGPVDQQAESQQDLALEPDSDTEGGSDLDEDLEDLDFELDAEFEDKPIAGEDAGAPEASPTEDEEIDLSDIEQMLEGDDALDTQQLEADFLGLERDDGEKGGTSELDLDDTAEIDLGEIEAAIDEVDSEVAEDTIKMEDTSDQELTLEDASTDEEPLEVDDGLVLELESDDAASDVADQPAEDDELDLSDLDLGEVEVPEEEDEVIDAGDIELEFQVEDDEPIVHPVDESVSADVQPAASADFSIEDTVPAPDVEETVIEAVPERPKQPKKKRATSKVLVFLLVMILLGGGGYLYYAVAYQGVDIPYVGKYMSQLLKLQPKDPAGILKLLTTDINSKFVDTEKSGRIFVIEGKVKNGYSVNRQMIRLQGKLFTKGKVLAKSEFAYAGVRIPDKDLINLPVANIKKKLNSGIAQGAATMVNPGGSLPFMIVFSELPDELDEFAIEVISSMPAK